MAAVDITSTKPIPASEEYYILGNFSRTISSNNKDTQEWFNRGLAWCFSFHHIEATRCFEQAILHDPDCAIAYWGLAYALGPNYNKPWELFDETDLKKSLDRTHRVSRQAKERSKNAYPVEQALIEALQSRYPDDRSKKDYVAWNTAYADAMTPVYQKFKDDLDVAALYTEAMMNIHPWEMWSLETGKPNPQARTRECEEVLQEAIKNVASCSHPLILHLYIHFFEMSPKPELAVTAAEHLRYLIPDAGHMLHMPSHLDVLIGDYRRAVIANATACIADEKYVKKTGGRDYYAFYRLHNYHSLVYAAMFSGESKVAISTCDRIEAALPEDFLRVKSPPMADWLETFLSVRPHVLIRFGKWQDVLDLKFPEDKELYCNTVASYHYAKGVAYSATGRVKEAEEEREKFRVAVKKVPQSRMDFPNKCLDVLAVAEEMLSGELEYRKGNYEAAFAHLKKSVALDDKLLYAEPWGWMQPTRHAFAALQLEQGKVEEAAAVYAADLGLDDTLPRARWHPNNMWALHGYHECLLRLGRENEARIIAQQLTLASAVADVKFTSSCYCRTVPENSCCSPKI